MAPGREAPAGPRGITVNTVLQAFLHPIVTLWRAVSAGSWRRLPSPSGEPVVHASGPNADRLLLVGGGIAVGYGALSHDLALGGHLARRLSELTGRGVYLNIHADPDLTLDDLPGILDNTRVGRFDALVLAFGGAESATLTSARAWRSELEGALAAIDDLAIVGLHVFVIGIPPLTLIRGPYGSVARRCVTTLNAQSVLACATRVGTTFVDLAEDGSHVSKALSRETYNLWADQIARQMADTLTSAALVTTVSQPADEANRQLAVDAMVVPSAASDAGLADILRSTQDLFGVATAAVNIIDGSTRRVMLASGEQRESIPREQSLCDATIEGADGFVVRDIDLDPRFNSLPDGDTAIRFYAGYPLEAPGGERVGALCLLDARPREFTTSDGILLRELALQAQAILWTHEDVNLG